MALRLLGNVIGNDVLINNDLRVNGSIISTNLELDALSVGIVTIRKIAAADGGPTTVFGGWTGEVTSIYIPYTDMFAGVARATGTLTVHCKNSTGLAFATCSVLRNDIDPSFVITSQLKSSQVQQFEIVPILDGIRVSMNPASSASWSCTFAA